MALSSETLYEKLKNVRVPHPLCSYTPQRCTHIAPLIDRIQQLKEEKDIYLLAHSYVHPDIVYGVADAVGDSYFLAKKAKETSSQTILFSAVRFMVETAKILNPEKLVLDPNPNGGCSLADSITAEDVYRLRKQYPQHTFICYINTTVEVKAACDVCVTSSNVYKIAATHPNDKIFFLPDRLMGLNVLKYLKENKVDKEFLIYDSGTCYVHEEYDHESIDHLRKAQPNTIVLAHPECKPEVTEKADIVGSTSQMFQYIKEHHKKDQKFLLLTECGISSSLQVEFPEAELIGSCMLCKYMRSNSLELILQTLENPKPEQIIEIEPSIRRDALKCLEAMFFYAETNKIV